MLLFFSTIFDSFNLVYVATNTILFFCPTYIFQKLIAENKVYKLSCTDYTIRYVPYVAPWTYEHTEWGVHRSSHGMCHRVSHVLYVHVSWLVSHGNFLPGMRCPTRQPPFDYGIFNDPWYVVFPKGRPIGSSYAASHDIP